MRFARFEQALEMFGRNLIPYKVHIDCTYRCNLSCIHCYQNKSTAKELSFPQIRGLISDLKKLGCVSLTFSGGEPFLRNDFVDIVDFAASNKFEVKILSNGTLFDTSILARLSKLRLSVRVSLYGIGAKTHDRTTGKAGSFRKTMEGFSLLEKYRIPFAVSFVIMRYNFNQLERVKNMAKNNRWNIKFNYVMLPTCTGDKSPLKFSLTDVQAGMAMADKDTRKIFLADSCFNSNRQVRIGSNSAYIAADGNVFPFCFMQKSACGNIKSKPFSYIWATSSLLKRLRRFPFEQSACFECGLVDKCRIRFLAPSVEGQTNYARPNQVCRFTRMAVEAEEKAKVQQNVC